MAAGVSEQRCAVGTGTDCVTDMPSVARALEIDARANAEG
jgi:hypothetical protein